VEPTQCDVRARLRLNEFDVNCITSAKKQHICWASLHIIWLFVDFHLYVSKNARPPYPFSYDATS
jgi:hypothetical protein